MTAPAAKPPGSGSGRGSGAGPLQTHAAGTAAEGSSTPEAGPAIASAPTPAEAAGPVAGVTLTEGAGGVPMIGVANPWGRARVSLLGGQVLSFWPAGAGADLLYLSERATHQPGRAIRGGVPVCWPWFGPDPEGLGRPAHGLARTRLWTWRHTVALPDGATRLTLGLADAPDTLALWPHAFDLSLDITVGAQLTLALTTRNTGASPFTLTQALHSYFAVADLAQAQVVGLHGLSYTDKAGGGARCTQAGAVHFEGEVDRVYHAVPDTLWLHDAGGQRSISVRSAGSRSAVVWNPGARVAAGIADLPPDGFQRFVCVETANAGDEVLTLPPDAEHCLQAKLGWQPLAASAPGAGTGDDTGASAG